MTTEERINKQKELVEQIGIFFDKEGLQPIAGRILGLLMVMDKEQFTFDEIIEELQISKSSASNALKILEIRGNIEYITLPGERKRYFQIKRHNKSRLIEELLEKMNMTKLLFSEIIELKSDKTSKNSVFYKELIKMIDITMEFMNNAKQTFLQE
jgi:DNA-binding transcriptional regulator GbsR (MarR family)